MADQEKVVRFLQTVPMFQSLNNRQLKNLARRFTERSYDPGNAIVTQGTVGIGLFIIAEGTADAVREHHGSEKTVVNELKATDFFGELSLLDEAPRTASVIATSPTVCLVLTQLDFMSALREDSDMAIAMLKELARRFRRVMERL
ncbi:MAG: cyclic nucleotide-binding domain-containing protein [Anaerolineaceae bacterium]|nr:cyclic nucleotide-binding domain-containing protein [Anaerolineaceae bacterium]